MARCCGGLPDIGAEGWAALSVQARRDIFGVVIDRVIVYPKESPYNWWAPPYKIKVLWRKDGDEARDRWEFWALVCPRRLTVRLCGTSAEQATSIGPKALSYDPLTPKPFVLRREQ